MDLVRTLNSVGKTIFVKYYYDFKNKTRETCIDSFAEPFTDKAKNTRTGHAQRIFRENKHLEALDFINSASDTEKAKVICNETLRSLNENHYNAIKTSDYYWVERTPKSTVDETVEKVERHFGF